MCYNNSSIECLVQEECEQKSNFQYLTPQLVYALHSEVLAWLACAPYEQQFVVLLRYFGVYLNMEVSQTLLDDRHLCYHCQYNQKVNVLICIAHTYTHEG